MPPLSVEHPLVTVPGLWHPDAPRHGAVVLFRRVLTLARRQRGLRLAITASHRYALRLDGVTLARGPSRADPGRWGVRTITLPPLAAGRHVLAVVVSHDGDGAGESQLGPDGFLALVGLDAAARLLDPAGWTTWHDQAVGDCAEDGWAGVRPYAPVGAHERFTAANHPWGWERPGFRATGWRPALALRPAGDRWGNLALGVQLTDETLPPMRETPLAWRRIAEGPLQPDASAWLAGSTVLRLPPRTTRRWVLDRGASGVHWPTLAWSGGAGAEIRLTWVEAPCDAERRLSPRDVVAGCLLPGHRDLVLPDGGRDRHWTPRWLRSGRYLVLDVVTGARPLSLAAPRLAETGFPFVRRLRLDAGAKWRRLVDVTDRTLRSCAHECIWDCPHFEQCQFPGDARVQSIAHYLLYGDDRLARKALRDFADAQRSDGLIPCRAPGRSPQRIDTFTLQWVLMLDEFLRWRGDAGLVRELLPAVRHALEPFLTRRRADGLIGAGLMAPFVDWSAGFAAGNAPEEGDGGSAIVTLLTAQACRALARLESVGWPELAPRWAGEADRLVAAARRTCLHAGLVWDTPRRTSCSVHAQVEAVHAGLFDGPRARRALTATLGATGVSQPGTRYSTWHLATAWLAAGRPDQALAQVAGWERQLADTPGLATWPESDGKPRSDCHGWGAYPVFAGAAVLLGVRPAVDGMAEIELAPYLPAPGRVSGRVPTPHGPVAVTVERGADGAQTITWRSPVPVLVGGRRRPAGAGRAVLRVKTAP